MSGLLDNVNDLLKLNVGDKGRLEYIKEMLVNNKPLYASDKIYLNQMAIKYLEKKSPYNATQNTPSFHSMSTKSVQSNPTNPLPSDSEKKFCTNCGNQIEQNSQFCTNCGISAETPVLSTHSNSYAVATKPKSDKIWYVLPIILGWIGGIVAWAHFRRINPKFGRKLLILGIVITVLCMISSFILVFIFIGMALFPSLPSNPIEDNLSEIPQGFQDELSNAPQGFKEKLSEIPNTFDNLRNSQSNLLCEKFGICN